VNQRSSIGNETEPDFSVRFIPCTDGVFQRPCWVAAFMETGVVIELNSKRGA
jgi:hypothetical protein